MSNFNGHLYRPACVPPKDSGDTEWVLAFAQKKLLMKRAGDYFVPPTAEEAAALVLNEEQTVYIGQYAGHDCYGIRLGETGELPGDYHFVELRDMIKLTEDRELFLLAGTANHILHWDGINQYCGRCGHKTSDKEDERAKICPNCGNIVYPRISPATITAIFRDDQILLAHNRNFKNNMYSLIAGYVEPGETLEQCVAREIGEEIGIKVKNIRYFDSQPWPFPDALMVAFTAEYESGEITVDQCEIEDAGWYRADSLPNIPNVDSIAGRIIRWYCGRYADGWSGRKRSGGKTSIYR